jgi:hypothetical protein
MTRSCILSRKRRQTEELRLNVFTLNEADLASLLGPAPSSRDMLDVRYSNIQEVLRHIAGQEPPAIQDIRPVPPDKLNFNRLPTSVQTLLTAGMQKADLVGQFFNDHSSPTANCQLDSTLALGGGCLSICHHNPFAQNFCACVTPNFRQSIGNVLVRSLLLPLTCLLARPAFYQQH